MITTFLSPDDERWINILEDTRHDVYHRPEYLRASAVHEGGKPLAFYAENETGALLLPLLLREIPETTQIDATSPYGYPTPLWTSPDPTSHWVAVLNAAQERGIVSMFVRLHPLLPLPTSPALERRDTTTIVEHGPTVWIDCTQSPDAMRENTRPDHRSDIRRLQRQDYSVQVANDASRISSLLPDFVRLYRRTMDRVDADPFYYFSDDYFAAWTGPLHPYCRIAVVRDADGEAAAAGLFTEVDGWMQFHLSGTADAHRKLAPSKLMLHEMRTCAHKSGNTRFHLGGGLGASRDSIFKFKAGFSSSRATFHSLRLVCDRENYRMLCQGDAPPPSDGFFPAYRDQR
jgi:hypothetical protein